MARQIKTRKWRFILCHIPKTGGTSLRFALEAQLRPEQTVPDTDALLRNDGNYPPLHVALALASQRAQTMRLFRGHYNISSRAYLPDDFETIVILRDPVQRIISQFRHMARHHGLSSDQLMARLHSPVSVGDDNVMTRRLTSPLRRAPDGSLSDRKLLAGRIKDPEHAVEEAIAALDASEFIGLTSHLPELEVRLSEYIGKQLSIGVHNAAEGPVPHFSPQEIARFERLNELDLRLYEYAVERSKLGR